MVKKLLALAFGLTLAIGAMAQSSNPIVPQDNVLFWTGKGSHKAVVAITWNDATAGNIGLAWGVRWDGDNITTGSLMDSIAAYDSRLTVSGSSSVFISNFAYNDGVYNLVGPDGWWWYNWKASDGTDKTMTSVGVSGDIVVDGDFIDWMSMDEVTYESNPADYLIMAVDPNAQTATESTIAASQIAYWVGEGQYTAILAVNWADTALAWGYRFDGTKSVSDMMNAIADADPRFSIEMGSYGLEDIVFVVAPGDTLRKLAYSWWESKNNGVTDAGMGQVLNNGDVEKWAEPAAGVVSGITYMAGYMYWSYSYVYPMTIHPVSSPVGINEVESVSVQVWPNPVATMLNVSFETVEQSTEAVLYDMAGRRVAVRQVAAGSSSVQMPVDMLVKGVYMLRVAGATAKVVVSR